MTTIVKIYRALPWLMVGMVFGGAGIMFNAYCQLTLNSDFVFVWAFFILCSMLALIKGYSEMYQPVV
jgi:hypothetical protein